MQVPSQAGSVAQSGKAGFLLAAPELGNSEGFLLVCVKIFCDNGACKYQLTTAAEEPSAATVLLEGSEQHSSATARVPSPS